MFEHSIFSSCGSARGASATLNETRWSLVLLSFFALAVFCMPVTTLMAQSPTPVPVLTWRYDLTHAGQNTNETGLTQANVNVNSFGKLFSVAVDSTVYSLPLYVPGLTMSDGLMHNVLFVATSNDSIYAFDADSNGGANAKAIWQVSLLNTAHGAGAGATAVPWEDTGSPDVAPTIGITGTGTIDPATNTLYVVAATKENGAYFSYHRDNSGYRQWQFRWTTDVQPLVGEPAQCPGLLQRVCLFRIRRARRQWAVARLFVCI